jgi:hypothetical protein
MTHTSKDELIANTTIPLWRQILLLALALTYFVAPTGWWLLALLLAAAIVLATASCAIARVAKVLTHIVAFSRRSWLTAFGNAILALGIYFLLSVCLDSHDTRGLAPRLGDVILAGLNVALFSLTVSGICAFCATGYRTIENTILSLTYALCFPVLLSGTFSGGIASFAQTIILLSVLCSGTILSLQQRAHYSLPRTFSTLAILSLFAVRTVLFLIEFSCDASVKFQLREMPDLLSNLGEKLCSFLGIIFPIFAFEMPDLLPYGFLWTSILAFSVWAFFCEGRASRIFIISQMLNCLLVFGLYFYLRGEIARIFGAVGSIPLLLLYFYAFLKFQRSLRLAAISIFLFAILFVNTSGVVLTSCINEFAFSENRNVPREILNGRTPFTAPLRAFFNNDVQIGLVSKNEARRRGVRFFFGLENRRKLAFANNRLFDFKTGEVLRKFDGFEPMLFPEDFSLCLWKRTDASVRSEIVENERGVFIDGVIVPGTEIPIRIPDFSEHKYPGIMKVLYHEIMFSIIDGVPYARLFDYFNKKTLWYRDIAYVGLFLEKIGRVDLLENFISRINVMYDKNRGHGEPDNLGNILYLQSLLTKPNASLIVRILNEARRIKDANGNLTGLTDGARCSNYANGWLLFGLKRLHLEGVAAEFNPNSPIDGLEYSKLLWFTKEPPKFSLNEPTTVSPFFSYVKLLRAQIKRKLFHSPYANTTHHPYPYIHVGKIHTAMLLNYNAWKTDGERPLLNQITYPITWGDNTRPHIWHAVELYFYFDLLQNANSPAPLTTGTTNTNNEIQDNTK